MAKILLIDDCPEDVTFTSILIERGQLGSCVARGSGASAMDACAEFTPDCLIVDYHLPDMNGCELVEELRRRHGAHRLAVVMLSGSPNDALPGEAMASGVHEVLHKSCLSIESLRVGIRNAFHRLEMTRRLENEARRHVALAARLDLMIEGAEIGWYDWDLDTGEVECGGRFHRLFGLPKDAPVTKEVFFARIHRDDRQGIEQEMQAVIAKRMPLCLEFRVLLPDSQARWINTKGRFEHDDDGRPRRLIGMVQDLTEMRRAQAEARRNENLYLTLADSMPSIVYVTDPAGLRTFVNPEWKAFTGRSGDAWRGLGWIAAIHPEDRTAAEIAWAASASAGRPFMHEYRLQHATGEYRWHLSRAVPVLGASGEISQWIGTSTDIHDRVAAEDALRRSNQDLERFAALASHDLKEPLRMVSSYLNILTIRYASQLDAPARSYINAAVSGASRMTRMVEGILDYSRLSHQILAIRSLDSGRALADALTNLETPISENAATITHDPMPMVLADQVQMTQLFQNLIGNGIKYCSSRAPTIHVSASLDHDQVTFRITDNGIGIDPTDVDRIFEMFTRVQVSDTIAGSGIGLASCKRIIERLGGSIRVESMVGVGTTVVVTLPKAPYDREALAPEPPR